MTRDEALYDFLLYANLLAIGFCFGILSAPHFKQQSDTIVTPDLEITVTNGISDTAYIYHLR
jgi:hypothetical protein